MKNAARLAVSIILAGLALASAIGICAASLIASGNGG